MLYCMVSQSHIGAGWSATRRTQFVARIGQS